MEALCRISITSATVSLLCELGVVAVTLLKLFSDAKAVGDLRTETSNGFRSEVAFTFLSLLLSVVVFCVSAVGMRKALLAASGFARRVTERVSAAWTGCTLRHSSGGGGVRRSQAPTHPEHQGKQSAGGAALGDVHFLQSCTAIYHVHVTVLARHTRYGPSQFLVAGTDCSTRAKQLNSTMKSCFSALPQVAYMRCQSTQPFLLLPSLYIRGIWCSPPQEAHRFALTYNPRTPVVLATVPFPACSSFYLMYCDV